MCQSFLIYCFMTLNDVKLKADCIIKSINIEDDKIKIRLMELGLIDGCVVNVNRRSVLKRTMLIIFNSTCFTLKDSLAKQVVVEYA